MNWKEELRNIINNIEKTKTPNIPNKLINNKTTKYVELFNKVIIPTFNEIKKELEKYNRKVIFRTTESIKGYSYSYRITMKVKDKDNLEYKFSIVICFDSNHPEKPFLYYKSLNSLKTMMSFDNITEDFIIEHFLENYNLISKAK